MKRIGQTVLLVCAAAVLMAVSAGAVEPPLEPYPTGISGEARWTLQGDTMYITGEGMLSGASNADSQPWEFFEDRIRHVVVADGVTLIGDNIFAHTYNLETVTVADSVAEICEGAFRNCSSLSAVKLSAGLERLGNFAFAYCEKLESIDLPDTLTEMGEGVFNGCSAMTDVRLPANLYDIRQTNFDSCMSLVEVTIPAGVGFLRHASFSNCFQLKKVIFEGDQPQTNGDPFYMGPEDLTVYCYEDAAGWDDAVFYTYPVVKLQRTAPQPPEEEPEKQPDASSAGQSVPEKPVESGSGKAEDSAEKTEDLKNSEPTAPSSAVETVGASGEPEKKQDMTPAVAGGIAAMVVYYLGSRLADSIKKNRKKKK